MDKDSRAWYDNHRDQILRGKDIGDDFGETDVSYLTKKDLQAYMDKKCYNGFVKTTKGDDFYSVFSALFKRLDKEEEMEEGIGVKHREAAEFGNANSERDDVMKFYQEWAGFSTMK
jgi:DnaJ homolog subfamily A member 5